MSITAEEFRARQLRLLHACEDLNLPALLILANGSCFGLSGRSQGYLGFLCGWNSFDSPSLSFCAVAKPRILSSCTIA